MHANLHIAFSLSALSCNLRVLQPNIGFHRGCPGARKSVDYDRPDIATVYDEVRTLTPQRLGRVLMD
jgi:hypothetical protein